MLARLFGDRQAVKSAARNGMWLMLEKLVRMVGGLFVGLAVARYLAPAQFGLMNTILSVYGLAAILCSLGLESVLVRFLVRYPIRTPRLIATAIQMRAFVAVLIGVFATGFAAFGWVPIPVPFVLGMSCVLFASSGLTIRQWFESKVNISIVVGSELVAFFGMSSLKVLGIYYRLPLSWFVGLALVEALIALLSYGGAYFKQFPFYRFSGSAKVARLLWRRSWPLFLSAAAVTIFMRIDQVMIQFFSGNQVAGIYAAATRISEIAYFIPVVILSSVLPGFTKLRRSNYSGYLRKLTLIFSGVSLMGYGFCVTVFFFSEQIVHALYGAAYLEAADILVVHIWAFIAVGLGTIGQVFILNDDCASTALVKECIAVAINIGLNLVLIPSYGGLGAAVATFVSYLFTGFVGNWFFPKLRPLFWAQVRGVCLLGILPVIKSTGIRRFFV